MQADSVHEWVPLVSQQLYSQGLLLLSLYSECSRPLSCSCWGSLVQNNRHQNWTAKSLKSSRLSCLLEETQLQMKQCWDPEWALPMSLWSPSCDTSIGGWILRFSENVSVCATKICQNFKSWHYDSDQFGNVVLNKFLEIIINRAISFNCNRSLNWCQEMKS